MILDFESVDSGAELHADVCLIGAGVSGVCLARELAGSQLSVILVESGGSRVSESAEALNDGDVAGLPFVGLRAGRRRGLGGTTAAWGGQCCEFDTADFDVRAWIAKSGWPLSRAQLEPYYRRAEAVFGVAGERYDEAIWQRFGVKPVHMDSRYLRTSFSIFSPRPRIGKHYRKLLAGAKNIRVLLNATATNIRTNATASRATSVEIKSRSGRSATITARAIVSCAGTIESARLLLQSRDVTPRGLGNDCDVVGRYFTEHPTAVTATIVPKDPRRVQELYGLLYRGRTWYWPKLSLAPELQREACSLNGAGFLKFAYASPAVEVLRDIVSTTRIGGRFVLSPKRFAALVRGAPAVVDAGYRRYILGRSPRARPASIELVCSIEQAPNADSRITLAASRDALGMQQASVDWRLGNREGDTFRLLTKAIRDEFKRLDLAQLIGDPALDAGSRAPLKVWDNYHQTGTTRMSHSAADGVVDLNGQVHGVSGLFVAGAPTFPTSGYANPVLTIAALSIRLADHLKQTYRV